MRELKEKALSEGDLIISQGSTFTRFRAWRRNKRLARLGRVGSYRNPRDPDDFDLFLHPSIFLAQMVFLEAKCKAVPLQWTLKR